MLRCLGEMNGFFRCVLSMCGSVLLVGIVCRVVRILGLGVVMNVGWNVVVLVVSIVLSVCV